jgi:hypothetical protein
MSTGGRVSGLVTRARRSLTRRTDDFFKRGSHTSLVVRAIQPSRRRRLREVRRHLTIDGAERNLDDRLARKREQIWGIAMVRNEEDVIRYTALHMFNQGVDRLLIADNMSSDGTRDLLADLRRDFPVVVADDTLPAYVQNDKMTVLGRLAYRFGARWVIPFDADELWFAEDASLGTFLASTEATKLQARMWNYLPTTSTDPTVLNPFDRLTDREPEPHAEFVKMAYRSHPFIVGTNGNHNARRPGATTRRVHVAHFPYRSEEQFVRKFRIGGAAIDQTDFRVNVGSHWRAGAALTDSELAHCWHRLCKGEKLPFDLYKVEGTTLVRDPAWEKPFWPASAVGES